MLLGSVLALCLVAYGELWTRGHDFVGWDDPANIVHNEHVRGLGPAELRWMLSATRKEVWEPTAWLLKAVLLSLAGPSPKAFHVATLALHLCATALAWRLTRRILAARWPDRPPGELAIACAFGVGPWALHPLRVEVVAWASGQPYALATVFALASALAYLRARDGDRAAWWVAATGLYALAVTSKAAAIALPAALLMTEPEPRRCLRDRRWWARLAPFGVVAAGAAAMALLANAPVADQLDPALSTAERLAKAASAPAFHLAKHLDLFDWLPHYRIPAGGFPPLGPRALAGMAALAGLTAAFAAVPGLRPALPAWLAHLALLAPMAGVVEHGVRSLGHDRYTYLSALPLHVALAAAWLAVVGRRRDAGTDPGAALTRAALALTLGAAWIVPTALQVRVWRDTESLWRHVLERDPDSHLAANNLGYELIERGRLEEAVGWLRRAHELDPDQERATVNLVAALLHAGDLDGAEAVLRPALERHPGSSRLHNNLGVVLLSRGRGGEARAMFRRALELSPDDPAVLGNLARVPPAADADAPAAPPAATASRPPSAP